MQQLHTQTGILWAGGDVRGAEHCPEAPPICHSTAYAMGDLDDYDAANRDFAGYVYSRTTNPTRDALSQAISYLEMGEETIVCSSGMAAISAALIALTSSGDHLVVNRSSYGETIELLDNILTRFGLAVTYVDFTDEGKLLKAFRPETKLVYTEIITNPLIEVVDIDRVAEIAREAGAYLLVDSTFTTPTVIRPLEHGADLVIHSLTKFFNGHSDVTAGSITGKAELVKRVRADHHLLGGCADANSSWLALRALRTLEVRMKAHLDNATALAGYLKEHPRVRYVNHPSLPEHPQHELAKRLFRHGFGPMLSFRVEDHREKVNEFIRRLKLVQYLGTLGGYRTSLAHPATAFRFDFPPDKLLELGMHEGLVRLSIGIEDIRDIVADLDRALQVFDNV